MDDLAFAVAESRFAVALEDLLDRAAGGHLDLVVGVEEGKPQPLRQAAADRGLAGPHQSDHDDRTVDPPRGRIGLRIRCVPHLLKRGRQAPAGRARIDRVHRSQYTAPVSPN